MVASGKNARNEQVSSFCKARAHATTTIVARILFSGIYRNDSIVDRFVFSKIRERFGGRLKLVVVGSAPIAPNVLNFIRAALGCTIVEGYGQTEVFF